MYNVQRVIKRETNFRYNIVNNKKINNKRFNIFYLKAIVPPVEIWNDIVMLNLAKKKKRLKFFNIM